MALSSSAKVRSGGGVTRRRVKSPGQVAEGVGAAERVMGEEPVAEGAAASAEDGMGAEGAGVAELKDRTYASYTTYSEGLAATSAESGAASVAGVAGAAGVGAGVPACLRLWLARARALGLTEPQVVFELHVRQGLPLLEVARVLGLGVEAVRELWLQCRAARAALAPQSELDFTSIREHISAALWQTVEATFPDVMSMAEADEDADPPGASSPPMLSVRLKALDQIAKLYDITLEQRPAAFAPLPYATPDDIADDVRLRVLEMHRRG
ncbi:MAG: hypothetical protein NTY98_09800 [Verrucomicrobia bacterium]|nr:hypothetical protein [Verrucomicrobiota bacterium]